jgi:hypothetical protein
VLFQRKEGHMSWFERTHARWVPQVLGLCIIVVLVAMLLPAAEARDKEVPYVPEIIEVEKTHAWCYVLVNPQKLIGSIHIMNCVPKGNPERNPDLLSLEEPEG